MRNNKFNTLPRIALSLALIFSGLFVSFGCGLGDALVEAMETQAAETEAAVTQEAIVEPAAPEITKTPRPTRPAAASSGGGTWTVMLYQDADDKTLEEDILTDLNEAERIGSTDRVNIVAQIDRYRGGFKGAQDFTDAYRIFLTQDDNLGVINSEVVAELGEINMADGATLVDFVTWAVDAYPADHYVLILSDHGTGWPGGWSDPDPANRASNIEVDGFEDLLYLDEIDSALAQIQQQTGVDKLDVIGFDACLMGSLEVLTAIAPYANYAVVSQETEPAMGWAYASFLQYLTRNPDTNVATLAETIVKTYIEQDILVIDDAARAQYVAKTYNTYADVSAAQLAREEVKATTLTAVDLSLLPDVTSALDTFVEAMSKINQKMVARARTHTQAFESVFGEQSPSPYIDLGHFAKLVKTESTSERVGQAADALRIAIDNAVIAEKHGSSKKGATGISIYFPNSTLIQQAGSDFDTYTRISARFAGNTLWDDFLLFHYTGQPIETANKPSRSVTAPGAEKAKIDPIELSSNTASMDSPATLTTTVTGSSIAYLYIFTGRLSQDETSLQIVDIDFIDAEAVKDVDGVIYPDWGSESSIPVAFDWQPLQYVISDGQKSAPALLEPDTYGAGTEDTLYSVDGFYHFADGDSDRFARLYFDGDGHLTRVMGFTGLEDTGPQHEITPTQGDSFTILDQWIDLTKEDETAFNYKEGETLTFGDTPWTWEEDVAKPGGYVVGIIAEDMDGNTYEEYAAVTAE